MGNELSSLLDEGFTKEDIVDHILQNKGELVSLLAEYLDGNGQETVPRNLIEPEFETNISSFEQFAALNTLYTQKLEQEAERLISDVCGNLQHHSIHIISATLQLPAVIGMDIKQFGMLFTHVFDDLQKLFPHSPMILEKGERSQYSENRLKLFITLYRLKTACSFGHLEVIFGWDKSSIISWFRKIISMLNVKLKGYHIDIIESLGGYSWMKEQSKVWRDHVISQPDEPDDFLARITMHNSEKIKIPAETRTETQSKTTSLIEEEDHKKYLGSVGAVDCTYSILPRISNKEYENAGLCPTLDHMYSEFVKEHAWKLSVITCHALGPFSQLILSVTKHLANTSDSAAFSFNQSEKLIKYLCHGGIFLLGDSAYLDDIFVVPPYPTPTINGANEATQTYMRRFNVTHSKYRVCAEHGIGSLKRWGVIRGRSDEMLFEDQDLFEEALQVCWAVNNFFILHKCK